MRNKYWTTAITKLHQEQRASHHVERQGFEFYLPQVMMRKGDSFRKEFLFPGYIFVKVRRGWETLLSTRGIRRVFMCGETPFRMAESDIESIRARENRKGFIEMEPPITAGTKVLVQSGAFQDLMGIVEHMSASGRCRVLVSMMERVISVEMKSSVIRAA